MNEDNNLVGHDLTINTIIERAVKLFGLPESVIRGSHRTHEALTAQWAVVLAVHLTLPELTVLELAAIIGRQDLTEEEMNQAILNLRYAAETYPNYTHTIGQLLDSDYLVNDIHPITAMLTQHGIPRVLSA